MCTNPPGFQSRETAREYSFDKTIKRAQLNADLWRQTRENLNFTGGEPTIHPRFLELCHWFRENFPENKLVLVTNGRMFSYPWFAKSFLKINNLVIETAILGPDEKLHDAITRTKGSFQQTTDGLRNIIKHKKPSQELEIRIILIKQNHKLMGKILDLILNNFPGTDRVVIIFPEPEGICGKNYKTTGITYAQVREKITLVVEGWNSKFKELRLYHFPLCTLEPELWKYTWITQRRDEVRYLPGCDKCSYKKYCCGIHEDYLKIIGGKEFIPPKTDLSFQTENNPCHPIVDVL